MAHFPPKKGSGKVSISKSPSDNHEYIYIYIHKIIYIDHQMFIFHQLVKDLKHWESSIYNIYNIMDIHIYIYTYKTSFQKNPLKWDLLDHNFEGPSQPVVVAVEFRS